MKRESQLISGLLLALLAAGCSTSQDDIVFISDQQLNPASNPAAVAAARPKLAGEDLFKVQVAVYGRLLQRHSGDAGEYTAVFLQGDDAEVAALIKQFPNHVPPVKPSAEADLRPNQPPLDRQTGKPAMILSVDVLEPAGDTVQAVGRWFAGSAASGSETFDLRKVDGNWVIESVK